jgi:hypothetical protein
MNTKNTFVIGGLFIAALNLAAVTGCVGGGGYVEAGGPAYYGDSGWIDSTVVVGGGHHWYGDHHDGAYVHPAYRGSAHVEDHRR